VSSPTRSPLSPHWFPTILKTIGISAFTFLFFQGYFYLLNHPAHAVTIVPATAVDALIGFQPWTLIPYLSLWVYVSLAPGLLLTFREMIRYGAAASVVSLVGFAVFYFFPTAIVPPAIDWQAHPEFGFLKAIDASGNACPSLHVAFAIFTACNVQRTLREIGAPRAVFFLNWFWALAITYSTIATKQHVALDALAGTILGVAGAWIYRASAGAQRNCVASGNTHA
jgi:membrane-associated phospholipid phosphatase